MIKASPYVSLFYREWLLDPERTDYHLVFDQSISGVLDLKALEKSLDYFLSQHVLFRSHLIEKNADSSDSSNSAGSANLYWQENQKNSALELYDFSKLEEMIKTYLFSPFDLEKGPLYRFCVFSSTDQQEHRLFLIIHHVLLSGLLFKPFIQTISQIYSEIYSKTSLNIFSQTSKTVAEIEALSHFLDNKQQKLKPLQPDLFWAEALKNLPESNHLPYSRSSRQGVQVCYFDIQLDQLENFSEYSTHNLLLLVWGVLITRYCHQEVSYIAYPVSIKIQEALQGLSLLNYAAQINTLIMPIVLSGTKNFTALYQETQAFIQRLKDYKNYPIDQILQAVLTHHEEKLKLNIGFSQTSLKNTKLEFPGCKIKINHEHDAQDTAGCELLLEYDADDDFKNSGKIKLRVRGRADLFQAWQLESLVNQYQNLLAAILKYPEVPVVSHTLPICISSLPWKERQDNRPCRLDREEGETTTTTTTLISLFESYARDPAYSERLALISHQDDQNPRIFSYQELNKKSNQLARSIRKKYFNLTGQALNFDALIPIIAEQIGRASCRERVSSPV